MTIKETIKLLKKVNLGNYEPESICIDADGAVVKFEHLYMRIYDDGFIRVNDLKSNKLVLAFESTDEDGWHFLEDELENRNTGEI